ncbi:MAG: hypothetical protein AAF443_08225 [Chlamydiota bacterium]
MRQTIALFGEAEKGELASPFFIQSLIQLNEELGNPPEESRGIDFAVQFLLYECALIYVRVEEEGFSSHQYTKGINLLIEHAQAPPLAAICLPGVGNENIISATKPLCELYNTLIITTERDLYDYLTSLRRSYYL